VGTYEVTSPEGKKYRVTVPGTATKDEILSYVQGQLVKQKAQPDVLPDVAKSAGIGLAEGPIEFLGLPGDISSAVQGKAYPEMRPEGEAGKIPPVEPMINPATSKQIQHGVERLTGPFYEPKTAEGKVARAAGASATNPLSYVGAGGALHKLFSAIGAGGGSEALGQMMEGDEHELLGRILGGAVGGAVPRIGMRVVTPNPIRAEREGPLNVMRAAGVEPTAGDVTGKRALRYAENFLGDAPMSGGAYTRAKERVSAQFTQALARLGVGEDVDALTPPVIQRVEQRLGDVFERTARQLPITHDARLGNDMVNISADLMREGLPDDTVRRITTQIDNVMAGFVTNNRGQGVMSGQTYQALTRKNTPLARAIDDPDPNVAYYALRIRSDLDDAMERSANARGTRPGVGRRQALVDLREARRQWYNLIVLSKATAGTGTDAAAGRVTPQKLRQMLTNSEDKKIQYAAGRGGGLQDLSHAGNEILTQLPDSGTGQRALLGSIPTQIGRAVGSVAGATAGSRIGDPYTHGIAGAVAGAAAPGMVGRALMTRPAQAIMGNQLLTGQIRALPPWAHDEARAAINSLMQAPWDTDPLADIGHPTKPKN